MGLFRSQMHVMAGHSTDFPRDRPFQTTGRGTLPPGISRKPAPALLIGNPQPLNAEAELRQILDDPSTVGQARQPADAG